MVELSPWRSSMISSRSRLALHVCPVGDRAADFGGRRVAALLAEGLKVREIAAATGWRETYVRWLVQQAYRKRGVSGQVDLVRQVLAADALPRS